MMSQPTLQDTISQGETLTVEFKSDRGPLDDAELIGRSSVWPTVRVACFSSVSRKMAR